MPQNIPNREYRFGTVLIQYDPQQVSTVTGQTAALVRVYVDGNVFPDLTWDPLPNQIPRKRSIDPAAGQVAQRDIEERDSDCAVSQQPPPLTTLLTSTIPATGSPPGLEPPSADASSVSSSSSSSAAPTSSQQQSAISASQIITTPPPVPMSYGVLWGITCNQTSTLTGGFSPLTECENYSGTYTAWTSWPATATPANPGNGLGLLRCNSLSFAGTSSICAVPWLASDISAIESDLSALISIA